MAKTRTGASKRKRGRPPGSKSKLPFTKFPEALENAKKLWNKANYGELSYTEIGSLFGLHAQKVVRVLNILKEYYGVVEKTERGGWRLTDAGIRAAKNDYTALKEVFSKDKMFADLYATFGDGNVSNGVILNHIKKNYKGVDAEEAKLRLLDGIKIMKAASIQGAPNQTIQKISQDFVLSIFQLRYALKPPSDKGLENLVEKVVKKLSESNDSVLKLISELMAEKKSNKGELANLLDKVMDRLNLDASKEAEEEKPRSD